MVVKKMELGMQMEEGKRETGENVELSKKYRETKEQSLSKSSYCIGEAHTRSCDF